MRRSYRSALAIGCGVVFAGIAAPAKAGSYKLLYAFLGGSDGATPLTSLTMVGGTLYGTTELGGGGGNCSGPPNGCGTVFAVNPTTGAEVVVHAFGSKGDIAVPWTNLIDADGTLYGATGDAVYSVNAATGADSVLYSFPNLKHGEGINPDLLKVGKTIYGTTRYGGHKFNGVVFSVNRNTGHGSVVYYFQGHARDGTYPLAGVINVGGTLYGTTDQGGAHGRGTVFAVNPSAHSDTIIYSFRSRGEDTFRSDGTYPAAGLLNFDGALYGVASRGGALGFGTLFSVNPTTGSETLVYSFKGGSDAEYPTSSLLEVKNKFYGTTSGGGAYGYGTVFWVDPTTGVERVVYSFKGGSDGASPLAGLIKAGGVLYGTTSQGGDNACYYAGCGTVFSYTP